MMTRFYLFAAVMFAAGFSTLRVLDESSHPTTEAGEASYYDAETAARVLHYGFFKGTLQSTLKELAAGTTSVRDAACCVRDAAYHHCPIYLERIKTTEEGVADEARVARNLVGHLREHTDQTVVSELRLSELESELKGFLEQTE